MLSNTLSAAKNDKAKWTGEKSTTKILPYLSHLTWQYKIKLDNYREKIKRAQTPTRNERTKSFKCGHESSSWKDKVLVKICAGKKLLRYKVLGGSPRRGKLHISS